MKIVNIAPLHGGARRIVLEGGVVDAAAARSMQEDEVEIVPRRQLDLIPDNGLGQLQRENAELRAKLDKLATPSPRMSELEKENAELRAKTSVTLGVGDGSGSLFVHGDGDSIRAAREKLFELEGLRIENGRLRNQVHDLSRSNEINQYLNETDESIIRAAFQDYVEWFTASGYSGTSVDLDIVDDFLFAKYPKVPTLEEKYAELLEAVNGADSVAEGVELLKTFVGGLDDASN